MPRRFSRACDSGLSVLELLVGMSLGLGVIAMGLSSTDALRKAYAHEIARARLQQDIRSALEVIGTNIRQAGEGFTEAFPAIELINGASGASDELILRKEILFEEPSVCASLAAGAAKGNIYFSNLAPTAGCSYGGNTANHDAWDDYLAEQGGSAKGYVLNTTTKNGEFFTFTDVRTQAGQYLIQASGGSWGNNYPAGASQMYVLEEWRFRLVDDELELIINEDSADPREVAFGLSDLQIRIMLSDGSIVQSFTRNDNWTDIEAIEVSVTGEQRYRGELLRATLTSRYFPRNVLSN